MNKVWRKILNAKKLAIDTETTGLNPWLGDMPFGISFYDGKTRLYFEWHVDPFTRKVTPDSQQLKFCKRVLESPDSTKVFFHAKFDIRMMEVAYGIHTAMPFEEVMFMAFVCHTLEPSYKLKKLAEKYVGITADDEASLKKQVMTCRRKAKKLGWKIGDEVAQDYWLPKALDKDNRMCERYCIKDSIRTMRLEELFQYGMDDLDMRKIYDKEMRLWPIIYEMESRGMHVNEKVLAKEIAFYDRLIPIRLKKFRDLAGVKDLNPDSPKQLVDLFYNKLKFKKTHVTKKGNPQVNDSALKEHMDSGVVRSLFKYRAASKANNSFFRRYQSLMVADHICDGYVLHPNFQQAKARTARLACKMPNFQNVPNIAITGSVEPIEARRPFGPRKGYWWYHFDFGQMEARIFADVSDDEQMLEEFRKKIDVFDRMENDLWGGQTDTAIYAAKHLLELDGTGAGDHEPVQKLWKLWGIKDAEALNEHDKERIAEEWLTSFGWHFTKAEASIKKSIYRSRTKRIFYLTLYGGGVRGMMEQLECNRVTALETIALFAEAFPNIKRYQKRIMAEARKNGYITNMYGRRLWVDRNFAYRAMNYMVQGTAADLLKTATIDCDDYLKPLGLDINLILSVHDESIFEIRKAHAYKSVLQDIQVLMADPARVFRLPMPVDIAKTCTTWNNEIKVKFAA